MNEELNEIVEKTEINPEEEISEEIVEELADSNTEEVEIEEKDKRKKKKKRKILIAIAVVVMIAVAAILTSTVILPNIEYNRVMKLVKENKGDEAYKIVYESQYKKVKNLKKDFVVRPGKIIYDNGEVGKREYDKYGNDITQVENFYEDKYDDRGNIIECGWYSSEGNMVITTKYDENNMLEEKITLFEFGGENLPFSSENVTKYNYEYDENNKVSWIGAISDNDVLEVYHFNEDGYCTSHGKYSNDELVEISAYLYDEKNRVIEKVHKQEEKDTTKTQYEYDEEGRLIKETVNGETTAYSDFHYYYSPQVAEKERENDLMEFMKK